MYQNDPYLDELLRKPLLMAIDDDEEYDEYDDDEEYEDEDDLFGDDILQAAIDEREAEEREAEAYAASLLGGGEEEPVEEVVQQEEVLQQQTEFTRLGIRRNIYGYALVTLSGLLPLVLLFVYMISDGMSLMMMSFTGALLVGMGLSFYHFFFASNQANANSFTVTFDKRTYLRLFPEVTLVCVVLLGLGFWNLSGMTKGHPFSLTGNELRNFNPFTETAKTSSNDMPMDSTEMPMEGMENQEEATPEAPQASGEYQSLLKQPVAGGAVGLIGGAEIPADLLPEQNKGQNVPYGNTHPDGLINSLFFGGSLTAAFGYAFVFAIAGLLIGLTRKFDTPLSQKTQEIYNVETAEVRTQTTEYIQAMQPINVIYRGWLGFTYGAIVGFFVGALIIVPLYILFGSELGNSYTAPILTALGVINNTDLAFANAVTISSFALPLFLLATKVSPMGYSVTDNEVKEVYALQPQGHVITSEQAGMGGLMGNLAATLEGGQIPSPAIINFGPVDEELEAESLMEELDGDEESLTKEIIDEFGREFEQIFGLDTRSLITKRSKKQLVDQRVLASALDESFGELGNVPVEVSAELGQASIDLTEWLNLKEGTLVLLDKPADEEIDILFNGVRKGKGKLIVSENALSVKVSQTHFSNNNGNHSDLINREIRV